MDSELLILLAIECGEKYGRQIQESVASLTEGKRRISAGALYTTLHRMEKKGLVDGRWGDDSEAREGARRRYYAITGLGLRTIAEARQAINAHGLQPAFGGSL